MGVWPGLPSIFAKINTAKGPEMFSGTEQNRKKERCPSRILSRERFLPALLAGRISHFTSRIYPTLEVTPGGKGGRGGLRTPRMKGVGMLVVLLGGVNFGFGLS